MTAPIWLQWAFMATFMGVLVWGAIADIRTRLIPNNVSIALVILYFLYSFSGYANWTDGLLGGLIVFLLSFLLFRYGAMGGGDAKLMTSIAFWVGTKGILAFGLITSLAGGVLALFFLLRQKYHKETEQEDDTPYGNTEPIVLPYGVAIAAGGLVTIWLTQFVNSGVI